MNEIQEQLIVIWKDVCKVDNIGLDDNFFEVGGTSAQIIELYELIDLAWPEAISVADIFSNPTINDLTTVIGERVSGVPSEKPDNIEF